MTVLIVGGGMAGLSAAYHLRDLGSRVRLVERDNLGSERGSSFGDTRMYREMYSDPFLCSRSRESNQLWAEIEARHGVRLRKEHGLLFYGESWGEETIEGSISGARQVMEEQGIPFEDLTASAIQERFPIEAQEDFGGLFEPTAGAIWAARALSLFAREARASGVRIDEGSSVAHLEPLTDGGAMAVFGDGTRERYDRVVVAAGGWTPRLVRDFAVPLPIEAWAMLWAHYEVDPDLAHSFPQWFCFQRPRSHDGGLYYGFPVVAETGTPVIKAGIDWAPPSMRAARFEELPREPDPRSVEHLDAFMHQRLRGVGARVETRLSPYAMTPDVQFILDEVSPGIAVFSGGSGQAFKFAPLIGSLLADLVRGVAPRCDIGPWRARRFS
ncbi:MAG: FAD-dependent oxidoreductase [Myxococcota bacterium]